MCIIKEQQFASILKIFLAVICSSFSFFILLHSYYSRYNTTKFMDNLNLDTIIHDNNVISFERDFTKTTEHHEKNDSNIIILSIEEDDALPWWDNHELILCKELENNVIDSQNIIWSEEIIPKSFGGHCGFTAFSRGNDQNVISFSIYGNDSQYWRGFPEILEDARYLYPDYKVRVYIDPRGHQEWLCPLLIKHREHFDVCDAFNLPSPLGNVSESDPRIWRMAPIGDPQVSRVLIRDSDSKLSEREKAAVEEWVESGLPLHIMRDHTSHFAYILAGMFGIFQTEKTLNAFELIRQKLFNARGIDDQTNLVESIPVSILRSAMQHDSFLCIHYPRSLPFPTQREDGFFVGSAVYRERYKNSSIKFECPLQCRPTDHQDWLYC